MSHAKPCGIISAPGFFYLGARRIGKGRILHHLQTGDKMYEIGEVIEDGFRIATRLMLGFDFAYGPRRIARHNRIEQLHNARPVDKPHHGAHIG